MSNHALGFAGHVATTVPASFTTGADVLRAIARCELPPPPAAVLLGLELLEVEDGRTRFDFVARPEIGNPHTAQGGVLAAIADFGVATAVWSQQPADAQVVTADLHVSYFRPIELDGAMYTCIGRVVHAGRTQVNAIAEIRAADDEMRALAIGTCRVLTPHPDRIAGELRSR